MTYETDLSISCKNRRKATRLQSKKIHNHNYCSDRSLGLDRKVGICSDHWAGEYTGTVTDTSGAVVVGATVTASNVATNVSSSSVTNNTGYFEIDSLDAATYKITVTAHGFQQLVQSGVTLGASAVFDHSSRNLLK
jgi:hypothetical protein